MTVLFVAATTMSGILLVPDLARTLGDVSLGAAAAGSSRQLLFVVRLRVFDDVKDAETDRREPRTAHSSRARERARARRYQRGTAARRRCAHGAGRPHLVRVVGRGSGWSVLMRIEFGVPKWLDRHPATFAVFHKWQRLAHHRLSARHRPRSALAPTRADLPRHARTRYRRGARGDGHRRGFEWGRKFERNHAVHGERGWSLWMLWPCGGAIGFALVARDAYPIWSVMALATVTLFTIAGHALVMGQRERPTEPGNRRRRFRLAKLRDAVELAPGASGTARLPGARRGWRYGASSHEVASGHGHTSRRPR